MNPQYESWWIAILAALIFCFPGKTAAEEKLSAANLFSPGAVLQRDMPIPVWGKGKPGSTVQVTFGDQKKTTTTTASGDWRVTLDPIPASMEPGIITVTSSGSESLTIDDVLVGEVWLCAGQSNMAMRVDLARDAEKEKAKSDLPGIRVHTVGFTPGREPLPNSSGSWVKATPDTVGRFSATGFFFGRDLYHQLGIPVGLIVAARGGSDITSWTSLPAQKKEPSLHPLLADWKKKAEAYTPEIEARERNTYELILADWKTTIKEATVEGREKPAKPKTLRKPVHPQDHHHHPATLFNGMIAPLIPYAIRGAIWYQGETNAFTEETSSLYEKQLPLLIRDWRKRWGQGDFPFAWVQLPFSSARQVEWARIRESMRRTMVLPNTGMVVTLDLGEERLLHPLHKQAFADRLSRWARSEVYGETIAWSGPLFSGHDSDGSQIELRFDHSEGLATVDGKSIAGLEYHDATGQEWRPLEATIQKNRVIIDKKQVHSLSAIRYAWANKPVHNLSNASGLPASPFLVEFTPATAQRQGKKSKPAPENLGNTPFVPADISEFPNSTQGLDIFLLMGQSNMKGRGVVPDQPLRDPQIIMMHKRTDGYFLARHPLHLTGDPSDFRGADNAGVGPGLAFAQSIIKEVPQSRILLIPCAVGGTAISKWQKGQRLYDDSIRRAKLALNEAPDGKAKIRGVLWLQGEADSGTPERVAVYRERLDKLISNLRSDLNDPNLPFIACTIGELRADIAARKKINAILLDLPNRVPRTGCVDGRAFAKTIGDKVHFDTATQNEHGRRYASEYLNMIKN